MKSVFDYMSHYQMVSEEDCIVAGVSGGADSVCLLFVLKELQKTVNFRLEAVHVEHGIRGKESVADAKFVETLCKTAGIPFHLYSCDVPAYALKQKLSLEEAARKLRYLAFEEVSKKSGANKIAVAHNENDQAETILWNLVRGSGLKGLGGMKAVNGNLIRPLLGSSRNEIEAYLREQKQEWRTDASNLEAVYTRNKLRNKVLPLLTEELNFQAVRHIAAAGGRMQQVEAYMERQGECRALELGELRGNQVWLRREKLLAEEAVLQSYILRYWLEKLGVGLQNISAGNLEDLKELAKQISGKRLSFSGGRTAKTMGEFLVLQSQPVITQAISPLELRIPGETVCGKWRIETELLDNENKIIPEKKYTKWLDYDTIKNTIKLRSRQNGDYFIIGDHGQSKKLKKYFIDEKVLQEKRDQILLLADGSHILWVVGYRISEACKVTKDTKKILKVYITTEE